jgi:chromosome segregation ATPase
LSQRIAELQQQKEETNEELRKKLAEALELREAVEEKSKVIAENSKQINGLLVQLNESRHAMQEEMDGMRQKLQQQSQQLAPEERADLAKNAELRRMKCENETTAQRLKGIEEEFANYRVRRIHFN